jgi:hypothetical protein
MPARKLAETDAQINALRSHVLAQCVAITSSIDTIPAELIPRAMRKRWAREVQQAADALVLVEKHLAHEPKTET